jgi:integrase/recombinase XerC
MEITSFQKKFVEYLRFEKRFSEHTCTAYNTDLEQFVRFLQNTYNTVLLQEINHTLIRSWVVSLLEAELDPRSANRKITTLKTFYKFLLKQQLVSENPMLKIQSPKTAKRLPIFVEKNKMDMLLDSETLFDAANEPLTDKLIIEIFYATGMRLSELISLKKEDVNMYNCTFKVLGKRNKERIIPFTNELKKSIELYLQNTGSTTQHFLFEQKDGKKLTPSFVYKIVNDYLSMVTTIEKRSPHVLRHTFATHMLNNGADLNSIKDILGHANLSATQVYTHNTVEKLKNIHKQAHPKA